MALLLWDLPPVAFLRMIFFSTSNFALDFERKKLLPVPKGSEI